MLCIIPMQAAMTEAEDKFYENLSTTVRNIASMGKLDLLMPVPKWVLTMVPAIRPWTVWHE